MNRFNTALVGAQRVLRNRKNCVKFAALTAVTGLTLHASDSMAANFVWKGGTGGAWYTTGNWTPAGPPTAVDTAVWDGTNTSTTMGLNGGTKGNLNVANNEGVGELLFDTTNVTSRLLGDSSGTSGSLSIAGVGGVYIANTSTATTTFTIAPSLSGSTGTMTLQLGSSAPGASATGAIQVDGANTVNISAPVTNSSLGAVTLSKTGTGNLILSNNANTFGGSTQTFSINAGTVFANNTLSTSSATGVSPVAVASAGTLSGIGFISGLVTESGSLSPGATVAPSAASSTLTLGGGLTFNAGASATFDLGGTASGNDKIATTNLTLPASGNVAINLKQITGSNGYSATTSEIPLFTYSGTLSGGAASSIFQLGTISSAPAGTTFQLDYSTPGVIGLDIMGDSTTIFWRGTVSNSWNTTDANWTGNLSSKYIDGVDTVNFDDNGLSHPNVAVQGGGVSPVAVNVTNTTGTYTFSGGPINGSAKLTKTGAGTLALTSANGYSGGTEIDGGVVAISSDAVLGSSTAGVTVSNATLQAITGSASITSARTLAINNATINTNGTNMTFASVSGTTGGLTKLGAGNLTFSAITAATTIGALAVNAGQLTLVGSVNGSGFAVNPILTITTPAAGGTFVGNVTLGDPSNSLLNVQLAPNPVIAGGNALISGGGTIFINPGSSISVKNAGTISVNNSIVTNSTGYVLFNGGTDSSRMLSLNSVISGPGSVAIGTGIAGSGGAGLVSFNQVNTYAGTTLVNGSQTSITRIGVDNAFPDTDLIFGGTTTANVGSLDLNGHSLTVTSISGGSAAVNAATSPQVIGGVANTSSTVGTLHINGSNPLAFYYGNIGLSASSNVTSALVNGNSNVALVLDPSNTGLLFLGASNNYTGGTTIKGGTLLLGTPGSIGFGGLLKPGVSPGSTSVVGSGAVLDLNALTLTEPVTLDGGMLTSSNGPGVLTSGVKGTGFTSGGSGVSSAAITYTGGGGTGATATASLGLTSATFSGITTTGYTVNPTAVSITGGGGTGATATTTLNGDGSLTITVTNPGTGYTSNPAIAFTGGGGTKGGSANSTSFTVVGITPTTAGTGYTSTPTPVIAGTGVVFGPTVMSSLTLLSTSSVGGDSDLEADAQITGVGGINKFGGGNLTVTNNNTYSGNTTVSSGTLTVANTAPSSGVGTGNLINNSTVTLNPGAGATPATVTGTGSTLVGATAVLTTASISQSALTVNGNLNITPHTGSIQSLSVLGALTVTGGTIDLSNNVLIVHNGDYPTLNNLVKSGLNAGGAYWQGTGINSSVAANPSDTRHITAIGVILNSKPVAGGGTTTIYSSFAGQPVGINDVLLKYTYYGDANLDGVVNGTDYNQIDNNFGSGSTLSGWQNGDFNYDGFVDGSDYSLIDNAYNTQDAVALAGPAAQVAINTSEISSSSAVPEPGTFSVLGSVAVALLSRRRRRM